MKFSALIFSTFILWALYATAAESIRCEAIFDDSKNVVEELARLRVDSENNPNQKLRKTIFALFEKKLAQAQKVQIDLSDLARLVDEIRNEKVVEQRTAQEKKQAIEELEKDLAPAHWKLDKKVKDHLNLSLIAMSPTNSDFATFTRDSSIVHVYSQSGVLINKLDVFKGAKHTKVQSVAFSPDGKTLLISSEGGGRLTLFDYRSGTEIAKARFDTGLLTNVTFSPDGNQVAGTYQDHAFVVDLKTGEIVKKLELYRKISKVARVDLAKIVKFSPDGESLFVFGSKGYAASLNLKTDQVEVFGNSQADFERADISANGKYIVTGDINGVVICWDAETKKPLYHRQVGLKTGLVNHASFVRFSPDGKQFVTATISGIRVWWTASGVEAGKLELQSEGFTDVAFSADSQRIFATDRYGYLSSWDKEQAHE